jgi:hypothetical protein
MGTLNKNKKISIDELISLLQKKKAEDKKLGKYQSKGKNISFSDIEGLFKEHEKGKKEFFFSSFEKDFSDWKKYNWSGMSGSFDRPNDKHQPNNWFERKFDILKIKDYKELKKIIWQNFDNEGLRVWLLKKQIDKL